MGVDDGREELVSSLSERLPEGVIRRHLENCLNQQQSRRWGRLALLRRGFQWFLGREEEEQLKIFQRKLQKAGVLSETSLRFASGARIAFSRASEQKASAVLILVRDEEGTVWLLSNQVGSNGVEHNYRLALPEQGIARDGAGFSGLPDQAVEAMGLEGLPPVAFQVEADKLRVLDIGRLTPGGKIKSTSDIEITISLLTKPPDRAFSAEEPPYDFQKSVLTPPALFKAGGEIEGWVLVSFDPNKAEHVVLAKTVADGNISFKSYPVKDFLEENNKLSEQALKARLARSRYRYPDPTTGEEKRWSYGGEIDGRVILFRPDVAKGLRQISVPVAVFQQLRKAQGLENHPEGRPINTPVPGSEVRQKEVLFENERENVVYCDKARILPDLHAGYNPDNPWGDFLKDLEPGEVVVFQELIDRGVRPWQIVDKAMEIVKSGRGHYVLGNHEIMFLAAMAGDFRSLANWLMEGGIRMLEDLGYQVTYPAGCNESGYPINPFDTQPPLGEIMRALQKDRRLEKVRGFNNFLQQYGKTYLLINNVLVIHAGVPVNPDGSLKASPVPGWQNLSGLELLDRMQQGLRSGGKGLIKALNGGNENNNPFWLREAFIEVTRDPAALTRLRQELNQQLTGKGRVEVIVLGHTPWAGGERGKTRSLKIRALFIDVGYYDTGQQRMVQLFRRQEGRQWVTDVLYVDPTGSNLPEYVGIYPL